MYIKTKVSPIQISILETLTNHAGEEPSHDGGSEYFRCKYKILRPLYGLHLHPVGSCTKNF